MKKTALMLFLKFCKASSPHLQCPQSMLLYTYDIVESDSLCAIQRHCFLLWMSGFLSWLHGFGSQHTCLLLLIWYIVFSKLLFAISLFSDHEIETFLSFFFFLVLFHLLYPNILCSFSFTSQVLT